MKLEFKPEDFDIHWVDAEYLDIKKKAASIANFILKQYIKEYGKIVARSEISRQCWQETIDNVRQQTHRAVLINIEEIGPCVHEPMSDDHEMGMQYLGKCKFCKRHIKPTRWEEEK